MHESLAERADCLRERFSQFFGEIEPGDEYDQLADIGRRVCRFRCTQSEFTKRDEYWACAGALLLAWADGEQAKWYFDHGDSDGMADCAILANEQEQAYNRAGRAMLTVANKIYRTAAANEKRRQNRNEKLSTRREIPAALREEGLGCWQAAVRIARDESDDEKTVQAKNFQPDIKSSR